MLDACEGYECSGKKHNGKRAGGCEEVVDFARGVDRNEDGCRAEYEKDAALVEKLPDAPCTESEEERAGDQAEGDSPHRTNPVIKERIGGEPA